MAVNYLHGVETIPVNEGPRPVNVVKSAVVGLIGISPKGPKQALTIVQNRQDAAQFGEWHKDNELAVAFKAIADQGNALCVVVNVFDEDSHTESITENITVANNKARLTRLLGKGAVAVVVGANTLVLNTDYEWNAARQEITILTTSTYPDGTVLAVTFDAVDVTAVQSSDILGAVTSGVRTGLELFDECFANFGFAPKILLAPNTNTVQTVASGLLTKANKYKGVALFDSAASATVAEAITGRGGTAGVVKNFATSSSRAALLYPRMISEDLYTSSVTGQPTEVTLPYSIFYAGVIANTDNTRGYWKSPSNIEIRGILRPERALTAAVNDANTEANLLNEKGIITVFNSFGTGFRVWGNRSAAFPTNTLPENFIPIQRVADVTDESIELASLQFIDEPINQALIDSIKETGNQFLRLQVQRGALIDGVVLYEPDLNPPVQIAAGQLVFTVEYMPPPPLERLTYRRRIAVELLSQLT